MKVLDLDKFMPEPREINLNGQTITVPGDLPVKIMLKLLRQQQSESVGLDKVEDIIDLVLEIIKLNPDNLIEREWIEDLGQKQFVALQNFIQGSSDDSEDDSEKKVQETGPKIGESAPSSSA